MSSPFIEWLKGQIEVWQQISEQLKEAQEFESRIALKKGLKQLKEVKMKLRNKKTGEIIELLAKPSFVKRNDDYLQSELNTFNSLAELNEEWEDYEEPKEFYFIDQFMSVSKGVVDDVEYAGGHKAVNYAKKTSNNLKTAGNYFETKEKAEKAVEKLKAWKRLKDAGFEPTHHVLDYKTKTAKIIFKANWLGDKAPKAEQLYDAFSMLFFGGKDE